MSDKYPFKSLHRRSFERVSKSYGLNRIADVSFDEETGSIVLSSKENKQPMSRLRDIFVRHSRIVTVDSGMEFHLMDSAEFEAAVKDLMPITWEHLLVEIQSLPDGQRKAMEAFIRVCNEPIPEGEGKEYLYGMIKMQAFMAGRSFEYERNLSPDNPETQ